MSNTFDIKQHTKSIIEEYKKENLSFKEWQLKTFEKRFGPELYRKIEYLQYKIKITRRELRHMEYEKNKCLVQICSNCDNHCEIGYYCTECRSD